MHLASLSPMYNAQRKHSTQGSCNPQSRGRAKTPHGQNEFMLLFLWCRRFLVTFLSKASHSHKLLVLLAPWLTPFLNRRLWKVPWVSVVPSWRRLTTKTGATNSVQGNRELTITVRAYSPNHKLRSPVRLRVTEVTTASGFWSYTPVSETYTVVDTTVSITRGPAGQTNTPYMVVGGFRRSTA